MVLAAGVLQECPLLKKMPSLKKTGDEQADQEQSLQRAALIEVIDNLWFHPEDALACSSWLKSRIQARERTPVDDDTFKVVPVTLGARRLHPELPQDAFRVGGLPLGFDEGLGPRQLEAPLLRQAAVAARAQDGG